MGFCKPVLTVMLKCVTVAVIRGSSLQDKLKSWGTALISGLGLSVITGGRGSVIQTGLGPSLPASDKAARRSRSAIATLSYIPQPPEP